MNKVLFLFLAIFTFWFFFIKSDKVNLGPGVMAAQAPLQERAVFAKSFIFKGYTMTPLARFEIKAKVLSKENYRSGRESDLSPLDLALGWGRMSDEDVLKSISISQGGRWYKWQSEKFLIPRREIETSSANMHMIPKDEDVTSSLEDIREGEIVRIRGNLVRVDAKDGWRWISSMSRDDTGSGACEIIFVESIEIQKK